MRERERKGERERERGALLWAKRVSHLQYFVSFVCYYCSVLDEKKCSANQTISKCEADCGKTCEEVITGVSRPCPSTCVSGCRCKDGYAKLDELCVLEEECEYSQNSESSLLSGSFR